jgi:diketogulonate reductase-like aldo/keto reductase
MVGHRTHTTLTLIEMSAVGLGVFETPPDETRDAVRVALGSGYRHAASAAIMSARGR